jgi:hypothetical protein
MRSQLFLTILVAEQQGTNDIRKPGYIGGNPPDNQRRLFRGQFLLKISCVREEVVPEPEIAPDVSGAEKQGEV